MQNEAADLLLYHGLCLEDAVRYHQGCDLRQRNVSDSGSGGQGGDRRLTPSLLTGEETCRVGRKGRKERDEVCVRCRKRPRMKGWNNVSFSPS